MAKPTHVAVFDFDGTLIPKMHVSCFNIVDNSGVLTPDVLKKMMDRRAYYLAKIQTGRMTAEEERSWYRETVETYADAKLSKDKIRKALGDIQTRPGVWECLKMLKHRNVPTAIISYNLDYFIFVVLAKNKISELVDMVNAGNLIFDQNGTVVSYKPETAVFPDNKGVFSQRFANLFNVPFENILAVGDSGGDMTLGYSKENRLGVAKDEAEKAKIEKYFGEVIITEHFGPVQEWLMKKMDP